MPTKKKKVAKKATPEKKKASSKKYALTIRYNGSESTIKTNDILKALSSLDIPFLKTQLVIKIKAPKRTMERVIPLHRARRMFANEMAMLSVVNGLKLQIDETK